MKNKFKIFGLILALLMFANFSSIFAKDAEVQINGNIIDFTDANGNIVKGQIVNNRTMVPLRKIFEVLGCEIEWDGATRTVIAHKEGKEITLQINNNIATKKEKGIEEKLKLDVAPMILNNRTLVPLRFVAEALDKQVGWDSSTYTAIIIDYDYFSDLIKQKNPALYNVLESEGTNYSFSITKNYIDKNLFSPITDSITINGEIVGNNVTISFDGNNELVGEIQKEGWKTISYTLNNSEEGVNVITSTSTLAKILGVNTNESYDIKLELLGSAKDDLSAAISSIFNIKDNTLTLGTFNKMKSDFDKFVSVFIVNGNRSLNKNEISLKTFDYTDFDNIIYNNKVIKNLAFINQKIFRYDVIQDDFLYDWNSINYTMTGTENKVDIKIILNNDYFEEVQYIISVTKI